MFLVSTRPETAGSEVVRGLKGRLQALVRSARPNALRRNYELHTIGSTTRDKTEAYVAGQLEHHDVDMAKVRELNLTDLQWNNPEVDLGKYRYSSHGRFCCNLHVSLRFRDNALPLEPSALERIRSAIRQTADKYGWLLSRVGLLEDHLHVVVGISTKETPQQVSLSLMNNIAWVFDMRPVLWKSCYAGTVGEYSVGAVRDDG